MMKAPSLKWEEEREREDKGQSHAALSISQSMIHRLRTAFLFSRLNGLGLELLQVHLETPDVALELEVLDVQAIVYLLDIGLQILQLLNGGSLGPQALQLGLNRFDLLGIVTDLVEQEVNGYSMSYNSSKSSLELRSLLLV